MVFPQFSLRQLLWLIGLCAIVCLLIAQALHGGGLWVIGLLAAIAAVLAAAAMYGVAFFLLWLIALGTSLVGNGRSEPRPHGAGPAQKPTSDVAQVRPIG